LQVVDVNVLIQSVVAGAPFATHHPVFPLTLDLKHTPWVCGAAYELRQVFANLVDNAIHYTPEGGQVTVRTFQQNEDVIVEVRDTGVGISASDLPHIFDRFYRTDRARSSETGGIGLGLSIAKKIVELHGGRLEAESELGVGSVFRVSLPVSNTLDLGASCDITPAA
jgi:signal transduction histidine kinase